MKVFLLVVAALGLIVGIGIIGGDEQPTNDTTATSNNTLGSDQAKVVLVEAADFECPACASYSQHLKEVRSEYSDRVRFEFVNFPLISIHPNALAGHRAAEAAAAQGKFWEMHDLLFEQRDLWVSGTTNQPVPQFEEFAKEIGLDIDQFSQDFASNQVNTIINNDRDRIRQLYRDNDLDPNRASTPTFFINGVYVPNQDMASPEAVRASLDQALADSSQESDN